MSFLILSIKNVYTLNITPSPPKKRDRNGFIIPRSSVPILNFDFMVLFTKFSVDCMRTRRDYTHTPAVCCILSANTVAKHIKSHTKISHDHDKDKH